MKHQIFFAPEGAPASAPGAAPAESTPPNPSVAPPEGLPEQFWDGAAKSVKIPDLIKEYGAAATFKTEHEKRQAELQARKPDDIKIEIKWPEGVTPPKDLDIKIDEKDPRVKGLRELAVKRGLDQDAINDLVALDVQAQLADHMAAEAELQAEQKKLGENGPARVKAMESFLTASVTPGQYAAMRAFLGNAEAFAGLEAVIKKAVVQPVPGNDPLTLPKPPAAAPVEQRWYGNTQQKAS